MIPKEAIAKSNTVRTRVYELLPAYVRDGDVEGALRVICAAIQEEYDRNRAQITDIITLIDPATLNNKFRIEGNFTFFHPEQVVTAVATTNITVQFTGIPEGPAVADTYVGFGLYVATGDAEALRQYRRIVDYNSSTRVATLEFPLDVVPTGAVSYVLCWPDRVWLPTEIVQIPSDVDPGTVLPQQFDADLSAAIRLPARPYIFSIDDYYIGWSIEFLSGAHEQQRYEIAAYSGVDRVATIRTPVHVKEGDWFKLVPPRIDQVSTVENDYKGRWLRVLTGPSDPAFFGQYRTENRRIIRSCYRPYGSADESVVTGPATHVAYVYDAVTQEGSPFTFPPCPDSYFGITESYVSFANLAQHLGCTLDSASTEDLQREQLRRAADLYRIKGTPRAFELICRTLGLRAKLLERSSNYVQDPPSTAVGPGTVVPRRIRDAWGNIDVPPESQAGTVVPPTWLRAPGRDSARIPSSDIELFVNRFDPRTVVDGNLFRRLRALVEDVRPIHIDIIAIGYFEDEYENFEVGDATGVELDFNFAESLEVEEDISMFIGGLYSVSTSEDLLMADFGTATIPLRYDYPDYSSYDTGKDRFDFGTSLN